MSENMKTMQKLLSKQMKAFMKESDSKWDHRLRDFTSGMRDQVAKQLEEHDASWDTKLGNYLDQQKAGMKALEERVKASESAGSASKASAAPSTYSGAGTGTGTGVGRRDAVSVADFQPSKVTIKWMPYLYDDVLMRTSAIYCFTLEGFSTVASCSSKKSRGGRLRLSFRACLSSDGRAVLRPLWCLEKSSRT